ncbi:myb-like protein M isoform X1 [Cotesia glomerata]|uniref:Uncharacterized protein n=1 Tax=Cotesia glomerata TaxID=32391 RepID=A0AAV7HET6_COTGL|nr:myb-like protein M isoform X1 [Cotesia glomerata]KAH0535619.1 hypothetical protein KQX54_017711 [Cotesia glomerata]
MRIICLITVGSIFLSVTTAEGEIPTGNNVQRSPRALLLKPVIKEVEDDGPFDFLANWISRMINPPKKPKLSMLGPIHVPGINDEVYLDNPMPSRAPSRVVIRMMPDSLKTQSFPGMSLQSNSFSPFFPISSTRVPMMSTNFHPMLSTASSWRYPQFPPQNRPEEFYGNNFNSPQNYYKDFSPQPYQKPHFSPNPTPNEPFRPLVPQSSSSSSSSSYSTFINKNKNHNSISGNNFNYGSNYRPPYSTQDNSQYNYNYNSQPLNGNISSGNSYKLNDNQEEEEFIEELKETVETVDFNKVSSTKRPKITTTKSSPSSSVSVSENEIYRADRMIPTNPSYKDTRYWRPLKTTSAIIKPSASLRPTTYRPTSLLPITTTPSSTNRYSARDIQEIPPPNLRNWREVGNIQDNSSEVVYFNSNDDSESDNDREWIVTEKSSDSRMDDLKINEKDEDGITTKDGITLGRGETQEHNRGQDRKFNARVLRKQRIFGGNNNSTRGMGREWKAPTTMITSTTKEEEERFTRRFNNTAGNIDSVMELTASNNWRDDIKKNKRKLDKLKNSNRRVRIVESVQSSVSMTSSKDT